MGRYQFDAQAVADAIRSSYPEKYSEREFIEFLQCEKTIKTKRELVQAVENMFDIDTCDAKDMVS
jgi:hypothetical protein